MFKKKLLLGMLVLALGLSGWVVSSASAKSLDLSSQSAQSQGNPPNGCDGDHKGPQIDLAAAAETLGVTEAELQAALGEPGQGRPDLAAAAESLGVTEAELHAALGIPEREAKTLDLAAAASTLGVSEAELQAALGEPGQGRPDLAAAAETLGVTETELHDALGFHSHAPKNGRQAPANAPQG